MVLHNLYKQLSSVNSWDLGEKSLFNIIELLLLPIYYKQILQQFIITLN